MPTNPPVRLLLVGPHGSGVSTQAHLLADRLDVEHLSDAALLRGAASTRTLLGQLVRLGEHRGALLPDDVMARVVHTELTRLTTQDRGYVLDGLPRTVGQAVALTRSRYDPFPMAVELRAPLGTVTARLMCRRVCAACGATSEAPSPHVGTIVCRNGDDIAVRRPGDNPRTIAHRFARSTERLQPLRGWLARTGRLVIVSGEGRPDDVYGRIVQALGLTSRVRAGPAAGELLARDACETGGQRQVGAPRLADATQA